MRSHRSDNRLQASYSVDYQSKPKAQDDHRLSISSLNLVQDALVTFNTLPNLRQTTRLRSIDSVINYKSPNGNGLIINGSLFDGHLFQSARSSYILDYANTPQDLNRFLEGHKNTSTSTSLDVHLYKLAFIITLSGWDVDKELLLEHCPQDTTDFNILEEISHYKRFCFPEINPRERNGGEIFTEPSTYIFTRTLSNGHVEYGYCRRLAKNFNHMTKFPVVFCIVSTYSCFKLYDALLTQFTAAYTSNELECSLLMQAFYSKPLPNSTVSSSGITCILNDRRIFFYTCPRDDRLNHDYFSTLLSALSPTHIVYLLDAMLRSKRILIYSNSPSKLTKCSLGLSLLLYPFVWPYSFVSLMPSSWLSDLIDSPCPFIYGCSYEAMQHIASTIDNETIYIDLDLDTILDRSEKKHFLPHNLQQLLESSLEYLIRFRLIRSNLILTNIAVSEACLYVFTELFYRLPDFFSREKVLTKSERHFSICSNYFQRHDSGIDLESVVSADLKSTVNNDEHKREKNRLGYEFHSDEFLRVQPNSSYVIFLKEFMQGMLFLKFLDDYQRNDDEIKGSFSLFSQRLNERRSLTADDLSIHPLVRFRQTFDVLEKQIKQVSKSTTPSFSRFLKNIFE